MLRQQDLLKRVVEVKPKRLNVSAASDVAVSSLTLTESPLKKQCFVSDHKEKDEASTGSNKVVKETKLDNPVKSLLAAYDSSDDED